MPRKLRSQSLSNREKILWMKQRSHERESGCWEWVAGFSGVGYGRVAKWLDKSRYAHRAMFALAVSPIPDGFYVLHTCDNRKCINPAHLFTGTHLDNTKDKIAKGRHYYKFSNEVVEQIKRAYANGTRPIDIQEKFKISDFWLDQIVRKNRRPSHP